MDIININETINFAKNLYKKSVKDAYDYLLGIYEENKNYLDKNELLKILLLIIEYHQYLNPEEDIRFLFNKALNYALEYSDKKAIILLYRYYCQVLYKNAKLNQCEILINNYFSNFKNYSSFNDDIKLKELEIAVTGLLKETDKDENSDEEDFFDLLSEEMDPDQIIKIIISFSRKFISSLSTNNILKLFNIFELGFEYILKNRDHFKVFHLSYAELHNFIGNLYYHFGLLTRAKRHFLRAFMESISQSEVKIYSRYQKNVAVIFYELGEIEKSNKYFEIIEKLYQKIDDPVVLNQFYSVLSLSYIRQGKYSLGNSLLKSAIKYRMSIKDHFTLLHTLNYAIIFNLFREKKYVNYYFIYFEKLVKQIPDSYYYLYYIFYLSIFKNKIFDESLFLKNLMRLPIYSFRLIPLFSLCLKYKTKLSQKPKFLAIVKLFKENFKREISEKNFLNFKSNFFEYSDFCNLQYEDDMVIEERLPFKRVNDRLEISWDNFIDNDIEKQKKSTILNLLYLKLLDQDSLLQYNNKKYRLRFEYKKDINSKIGLWAQKVLFSRLNLDKIVLLPIK